MEKKSEMKLMLKKVTKHILLYVLLLIILLSSYFILMTLSSLIPSSAMEDNVRSSSETLVKEGEKKKYELPYRNDYTFNFTDALMINTAYSVDSKNPIKSFMLARKNYIPGQTIRVYPDSQYNLGADARYINPKNGDLYQTKELAGLMNGVDITDSFEYARYWHGYLVILRPLLVLFDYNAIRIIMLIVTILLIGAMLYLIYKKINLKTSIIYLLGLLLINIFHITQGINEILVFLVAFISTIVVLLKKDKRKNIGLLFFAIGSITTFIDLLTEPLVTFGLPAITYFLLRQKEEKCTIKQYILEMLQIGISWAVGYGLTWGLKWVFTELMYGRPLISQAIEQAVFRSEVPSVNGKTVYTGLYVILRNIKWLGSAIIPLIIIISATIIIITMIKNVKENIDVKGNLIKCLPYIAIFTLPFIWYLVLKQHSAVHVFFTNRILVISIICLFIIAATIFSKEKTLEKTEIEGETK